jgi:hypothetical protein
MRARYSLAASPPALVVRVRVESPAGERASWLDGELDTGADITAIPEGVADELNPAGSASILMEIKGATDAEPVPIRVCHVLVSVPDLGTFGVKAAVLPCQSVLLGRDILNQVVLHADGPRLTFDLTR